MKREVKKVHFTERIASLDHKALDDSVEDVRVVVAVLAVHAKVLHRLGTFLAEQLDVDVADGRVQDGRVVDSLRACNIQRLE